MKSQRKLDRIDKRAARYSRQRATLARRFQTFQEKLAKLQARHLPKIQTALVKAAATQSTLEAAIAAAPEFFKEPRTLTLHGIRLGFMEGRASVKLPRAEKKIAAFVAWLRDRFTPEQLAELKLISEVTIEAPSSDALTLVIDAGKLDAKALPADVTYVAPGDRVFIKPVDHALDKVISKVLAEGLKPAGASEETPNQERDAA